MPELDADIEHARDALDDMDDFVGQRKRGQIQEFIIWKAAAALIRMQLPTALNLTDAIDLFVNTTFTFWSIKRGLVKLN